MGGAERFQPGCAGRAHRKARQNAIMERFAKCNRKGKRSGLRIHRRRPKMADLKQWAHRSWRQGVRRQTVALAQAKAAGARSSVPGAIHGARLVHSFEAMMWRENPSNTVARSPSPAARPRPMPVNISRRVGGSPPRSLITPTKPRARLKHNLRSKRGVPTGRPPCWPVLPAHGKRVARAFDRAGLCGAICGGPAPVPASPMFRARSTLTKMPH